MLLFLPTFVRAHDPVPPEGWTAEGEPYRLYRRLEDAEKAAVAPDGRLGRILVLDPDRVEAIHEPLATNHVPREAVLNVDPDGDHWPPVLVAAGGGIVVRRGEAGPEVLMIFRRGAWDLPKGKLDEGETVEEAARREVAEEVGIEEDQITVTGFLAPTVHGYLWPKAEGYAVKTSYWYGMTTTAEAFEPEEREGIEEVAWTPWAEAADRVGFETLRDLLERVDPEAVLGADGA